MKSNLFKSGGMLSDSILTDLTTLESLSNEQLEVLFEWIVANPTIKDLETTQIAEGLGESINVPGHQAITFVYLVRYLYFNLIEEGDSVEDILDDFVTLEYIAEPSKDKLSKFFYFLVENGEELRYQLKKSFSQFDGMAYFVGIDYVSDLRLILKEKYSFDNKIEDYKPEVFSLEPIAIIQLITNNHLRRENFSFQANFESLERLINELQACQKNLRLLQDLNPSNK